MERNKKPKTEAQVQGRGVQSRHPPVLWLPEGQRQCRCLKACPAEVVQVTQTLPSTFHFSEAPSSLTEPSVSLEKAAQTSSLCVFQTCLFVDHDFSQDQGHRT